MHSLKADILARPTFFPPASTGYPALPLRLRRIRHPGALARHARYHLYRFAGRVVLVAGSWAG